MWSAGNVESEGWCTDKRTLPPLKMLRCCIALAAFYASELEAVLIGVHCFVVVWTAHIIWGEGFNTRGTEHYGSIVSSLATAEDEFLLCWNRHESPSFLRITSSEIGDAVRVCVHHLLLLTMLRGERNLVSADNQLWWLLFFFPFCAANRHWTPQYIAFVSQKCISFGLCTVLIPAGVQQLQVP